MPKLAYGRIIWATVPDPQGTNPKSRPLVVVTSDSDLAGAPSVRAVAISTQVDASPADVSVALPWQNGGHPRTGLNRPNVAVCTWIVEVPLESIESLGGLVTGKPIHEIDAILRQLAAGETANEPE